MVEDDRRLADSVDTAAANDPSLLNGGERKRTDPVSIEQARDFTIRGWIGQKICCNRNSLLVLDRAIEVDPADWGKRGSTNRVLHMVVRRLRHPRRNAAAR